MVEARRIVDMFRRLIVVVALVLLPTALTTPPASADFQVNVNTALAQPCGPTFIGLHGLNEGPESPTIQRTWESFAKRTSVPASEIFVNHDRLTASEFVALLFRPRVAARPINAGVELLTEAVKQAGSNCYPSRIVLAGYSQGAWIVDQWLRSATQAQLDQVVGVAVLGDPQWDNGPKGQGLAQRSLVFRIRPYIPPKPVGDRFVTVCAVGDPICGEGYGPSHAESNRQHRDALALDKNIGAHGSYISGGVTDQAGAYLASLTLPSAR
jgi:hypothetical protein